MHLRNAALAAITTTAALVAAAPAAQAGTYTVEACRDRNANPTLAIGDASYGWQSNVYAATGVAENQCASGYSTSRLMMRLSNRAATPFGGAASWYFLAPPGTSISGYDVWWSGVASAGSSGFETESFAPRYDGGVWGNSGNALDAANRVSKSGLDQAKLGFSVACGLGNGCPGTGADDSLVFALIYRSAVKLVDGADPQVTQPGDAVLNDTTWHGVVPVQGNATDTGAGIYRLLVDVDGSRYATRSADADNTRCRQLYDDEPFTFDHPRPCSTAVSLDVPVDTAALSDGSHHVVLKLQDAAGNTSTIFDRNRVIDNVAPEVGAVALSGTARAGDDLTCSATVTGQSATVTYQWLRAAVDGSGLTAIPGATAATRRVEDGDVGRKLICRLTAMDGGGTTTRESTITQPPFNDGATVAAYCSGRPTGAQDPCGDRDGDGVPNRSDASPDGATTGSDAPVTTPATPVPSSSTNSSTVKETTRESERTLVIERGASNGDGASDDARLTAFFDPSNRSVTSTPFGRRVVIAGKLTDARGAAIGAARLDVAARSAHAGAVSADQPSVATRSDGTFTMIVPKGVSSRTITLRYRSHERDEKPAATASVDLRVVAGVALSVSPKHSHNHGTIRFAGSLLGKPVPAKGKLVELQARARGTKKWITFRTIRAARSGRFSARYTFRATYGAITYEFRARARQEAAYPFLTGSSRVVRVRVR